MGVVRVRDGVDVVRGYVKYFGSIDRAGEVLGLSRGYLLVIASGSAKVPRWMRLLLLFMERVPMRDWPDGMRAGDDGG